MHVSLVHFLGTIILLMEKQNHQSDGRRKQGVVLLICLPISMDEVSVIRGSQKSGEMYWTTCLSFLSALAHSFTRKRLRRSCTKQALMAQDCSSLH
jgi:hypothetical protein